MLKVGILKAIITNPWKAIEWVAVYFIVGALWGLLKWYVFVHKALGRYRESRAMFLQQEGVTELTPELAVKFAGQTKYRDVTSVPPLASDHKSDIIRWMSYWPFSMIGTVLNDVVRKAWQHIYIFMAETYDRVANYVFRSVRGDAILLEKGLKLSRQKDEEENPRRKY